MTNNESESRCASPAFAVAFGKEATRAQLWRWRCAGEASMRRLDKGVIVFVHCTTSAIVDDAGMPRPPDNI
jgi:hypothetical protein